MAATYADLLSTLYGIYGAHMHLYEAGILGTQNFEMGNLSESIILRVAVPTVLTGIYALSKENPNRLTFTIDKTMRIANVLCWAFVALNTVQFVLK